MLQWWKDLKVFSCKNEEEESTAEENIVFIASDEKPTAVEEPKMCRRHRR
jgi:hypothetical protein